MAIAVSILVVVMLLSIGAIGVFAMLVIGIRRDDRDKHLMRPPRTRIEATTRRMLGFGGCGVPTIRGGNARNDSQARN